jgi:hypothetical protein
VILLAVVALAGVLCRRGGILQLRALQNLFELAVLALQTRFAVSQALVLLLQLDLPINYKARGWRV